jgi:hypothetical protein
MHTAFRTSILASVFVCAGVAGAVAQGTAAPPDPHHPAGESGAVTAPAGAPEAAGMPPAVAAAGNPPSGGMMVMMTPDMMQMMMEMMTDQCMMSGGRQAGPRLAGNRDEQSRHRTMAGDEMGGPGARPRGPMREQMADRAPMLPLVPKLLSVEDVGRILAQHLEVYANPRLRVGTVAVAGEDTITAVVETVDGSLVERLVFDRFTGEFARADE